MAILDANARWNATRRDTFANNIRRIVGEISIINPDQRNEFLFIRGNAGLIKKKTGGAV